MNELDAMNMMLRAIGSRAVNDVNTTHPDAENARATLDRVRQLKQSKTLWFNVDYDRTFEPDGNGKILIPSNVTALEIRNPCNFNNGFNPVLDVVRNGNYLYNKRDQTSIFSAGITYDRVRKALDWDDLPVTVQQWLAYEAAVMFVDDQLEDPRKMQNMKIRAIDAKREVDSQHLAEMNYSLYGQPSTAFALAGQVPYLRGNRRAR